MLIAYANCEYDDFICIFVLQENNKSYNDHAQDHITGMNLTEAAKQTCYFYENIIKGVDGDQLTIERIDGTFFNYAETSEVCYLKVNINESDIEKKLFVVDIIQYNQVTAKITIKLARIYE